MAETPPVAEAAAKKPLGPIKFEDLTAGGKEAGGLASGALKKIMSSPKTAVGIPAAITALALLLWPKKETEVTNDQGQPETRRKNSFLKNAVVTAGAIVSLAALSHHIGPTKGWAGKILEGRAMAAASKATPSV